MEKAKIILITPPDIFENDSKSVLFIHLSDNDQEIVSKWLAEKNITNHVNIYFFDTENDVPWLLHSMARCDYRFIDLSRLSHFTEPLAGYILGKTNTFYKVENETTASICYHINQNRISNVTSFLEKAFDDQA